jgi:DtxR family transcriptional regulator, Mn-dependent transcriptional regulator
MTIKGGIMAKSDDLTESMENYLETILALEAANKVARAKEIAEKLEIQRGSVTGGLKTLSEKGLINYEPYSYITLTPEGKRIAREVARRHAVLRDFLANILRVEPAAAEANACRMEHAIDSEVLERLICFIEYIHTCPRAGNQWIDAFVEFCTSESPSAQKCQSCIKDWKASH